MFLPQLRDAVFITQETLLAISLETTWVSWVE